MSAMGVIEEIYEELDADISEAEFREAIDEKVEQMGGLADEETAAMLVAREYGDRSVEGVADIQPGLETVQIAAKVVGVGELRTFEREDPGPDDAEEGQVLNARVADETGEVRVVFWDERAAAAAEELEVGQVLRIGGRPTEGYQGVEIHVDRVEPADDVEIDVVTDPNDRHIEDLAPGASDVVIRGRVLATESVREFDRDDGSEGRVSNIVIGDESGRVRVTLWDARADAAERIDVGVAVEIAGGNVRERDGNLELHVGSRGTVETLDDEHDIEFVPDSTPIADLALGETVDIAGVVRSTDPTRTFDRDDGTQGQVRNIRLQDESGDIRVALWGEKADVDIGPGDELLVADVEIQEGWQDDLEASAGWQATLVPLADGAISVDAGSPAGTDDTSSGLDAFATDAESTGETSREIDPLEATDPGEVVEFTGVVVQSGDPVILDDGERTLTVETSADLTLGQEVTVRGTMTEDRLDADDVV